MKRIYFFRTVFLLLALIAGSTRGWAKSDTATLPFSWDGGTSSGLTALDGVTASGLGSDYAAANAPYRVKFDTTGDYILIKTDGQPGVVTIGVKMLGGNSTSSIKVQGSSDGTNFTDVETLSISGSTNDTKTLTTTKDFASTDRYVKLYFTKGSNVGVGPIAIATPSAPAYEIKAISNNDNYGTVSLTGSTITGSPADGYRYADPAYTVTGGTATVSQVGNAFTVTPTSDCTVCINFEAIPTYFVTITTPTGGTLTVKDGDDTVSSGDEVADGTVLTITATPDEDYNFRNWQAVDASTHTYTAATTYTMNGHDVTLRANFDAKVFHDAIFKKNGNVTHATVRTEEGKAIAFPSDPADYSEDIVFMGWVAETISGTTDDEPTFVTSAEMGESDVTYYACYAERTAGSLTTVSDALTTSVTGVSGTSYTAFSGKSATSDAVYAGNCANNSGAIQLRSSNNSGIVTTTSGGKVKKITVVWDSGTTSGRTLDIYGANSAYTAASNLYSTSTQGTKLGSIVYGTSTVLNVTGDYAYIGMRSNSNAMYLTSITIDWETGTPDTYSDYCTTVSALPKPVITLSATDIDMTWGDTDKVLTASATLGEEDFDGTITLTSSDENLTIDGSGNIRCNVPGSYTITASIAEKAGEYQAAKDVTCAVTVDKQDATLTFAESSVQELKSAGSYTQTATKTPAGAGTVTYAISPSGNAINSTTGAVTLSTTGDYTVTATAAENTLYNEAVASYTLQVRQEPTIVVADDDVVYGTTFTVDDDVIEGGTITVTSSNTAVATVDGLTLTPVAAGETTVTVSTAANDTYIAGEETFVLTVTQPAGGTSAKSSAYTTTFTAQGLTHADGEWDWTANNDATGYEAGRRAQWSNSVSDFTLSHENSLAVNKVTVVASTNGSDNSISVTVGSTAFKNGENTSLSMSSGDNNKSFEFSGSAEGNIVVSFSHSGSNRKSIWVKSISVELAGATETVTLNASGYATFCSAYPLDFSSATGYTAWQITDITDGVITFEKLTGDIKGGQGFLLKGTANAVVSIPSEDSSTELGANLFCGTLVPEYFEANAIYGLSGDKFYQNNAGTFKAGKAYLPASSVGEVGVKGFTFVFDDTATGVQTVETLTTEEVQQIFDLAGRRLPRIQRGLNIVNGKKVIMK